jgi:hypothetical protein
VVGTHHLRRWLVAESFRELGQPDSAVAYYGLLTEPANNTFSEVCQQGVLFSFAHRYLALLHTELGQLDHAQSHWLTFLEAFTEPDPDYGWMVEEGRAELERLGRER